MSSPIESQVFDSVVAQLQQIGVSTGYENTLNVYEERQRPVSPGDRTVVVVKGDPQQVDGALGFDTYDLPLGIIAFAVEPDASGVNLRPRLESMAADLRKSLGVLAGSDARLFINLTWPEKDQYSDSEYPASVVLAPHLLFRTLRNNPNTQS